MNAAKLSRREALARAGLLVGTAAVTAKPAIAAAAAKGVAQTPLSG